jgi:serine/threonine protein kinase/tetratricopeptide (TPR) repeat protein
VNIALGPFLLHEVIGRAGMGVVWRGVHIEQQIPVAIKVLTTQGSRDPLYIASMRNEIRRVAGLDHPAVVRVFDQGVLPSSVASQTGGEMVAGSPYLAMEFAEGGTLRPLCGRLGWAQIWRVLLRLLDGLAHAHARGVIHRDIKPSNILLRHVHGGAMISDFGLARAGDQEQGGEAFLGIGTPSYMAPEQVRQDWRNIGPWTDLYALGCLAFTLVEGRPPFGGETVREVLQAHLQTPPPALSDKMLVPPGFEQWVFGLMRKDPTARFRRAADAAWALLKLIDETDTTSEVRLNPILQIGELLEHEVSDVRPLIQNQSSWPGHEDTMILGDAERAGARVSPNPSPLPELEVSITLSDLPEVPPVPGGHRPQTTSSRRVQLLGTGLGIFGLRDLPVIGREEEQTQLWSALENTLREGKGRAVVLRGAPGSGKTHLARWLAQRAHEVGAAIVLRVELVGDHGTRRTLAPLVHQLMGTIGMNREDTRHHLIAGMSLFGQFHPTEIDALVNLLGPYGDAADEQEQDFDHAKAWYVLVRRMLQQHSAARGLFILLDDVHTSADAIAFVRHLVRAQAYAPHPIMLVLTAANLGMFPGVESQFDDLCALPGVTTLTIGPLAPEHRSRLVREILGLDRTLAELVERRSGGNPQFAVQLVGDWVQKGFLQLGENGFSMRDGIRPEFPADLRAIWERRLSAVLPPERDARSLELAAVLGHDVDAGEWVQACSALGVVPAWDLVDALLEAHLALSEPGFRKWRFSHGMVVEAFLRQAGFAGRKPDLHRAAAEMLAQKDKDQVGHRLGRHLLGSGQYERAVSVLLDGARTCIRRSEGDRAWALLLEREGALTRLKVPKSDLRWASGWLLMARSGGSRNELDRAVRMYERALQAAESDPNGSNIAAQALYGLGRIARVRGRIPEAREHLAIARQLAEGHPWVLTNTLIQLASLESNYGEEQVCRDLYEQALSVAETGDNLDSVYDVRFNQAGLFRRIGDWEAAKKALNEVREWCLKRGWRVRLAQVTNDLAEIDRLYGDPSEAARGYREALRLYEAVGARQSYVPRINLGIMAAQGGRTIEARDHVEQVLPMLKRMGIRGVEGLAHLVVSLVATLEQTETEAMVALERGIELQGETGFVDVDVAIVAELIGDAALAEQMWVLSRRSYALARDHFELLEREEEAARVVDLLAEVDTLSG